jgi:integrase
LFLAEMLASKEGVSTILDALHAGLTSSGVAQTVDVLRTFGRFAVAKGWIEGVALEREDRPPENPIPETNLYPHDHVVALVRAAYARDLRFGLFLDHLEQTGRRVGETLRIQWEWLFLDADTPHYRLPPEAVKTRREAYVPLSADLVGKYVEYGEELRRRQRGTRADYRRDASVYVYPFTYETAWHRLEHLCSSLGVPCRGFHALRHAKATELLSKGVPLQAVSALLGHSVQVLQKRYNHTTGLTFAHYMEQA